MGSVDISDILTNLKEIEACGNCTYWSGWNFDNKFDPLGGRCINPEATRLADKLLTQKVRIDEEIKNLTRKLETGCVHCNPFGPGERYQAEQRREELKKEYVTIRKSLEGFPYNVFMKCDLYKK
jgi:hypothetical protein